MIRWMLAGLSSVAIAAPALAAPADPERVAVIAAVQQFFDGMSARDTQRMGEVLLAEGSTASVRVAPDGAARVRIGSQKQFLEPGGGDQYLERMWDPVVTRRGPLAIVWAPYEFQLN